MSSSGGLGLYIPEEQKWAPAHAMLKHFYNDVPVGSTRMQTQLTGPADVMALAFRLPDSSDISVILINSGRSVLDVNIIMAGGLVKLERVTVSEPMNTLQDRMAKLPVVIPPESVSSFKLSPDQ